MFAPDDINSMMALPPPCAETPCPVVAAAPDDTSSAPAPAATSSSDAPAPIVDAFDGTAVATWGDAPIQGVLIEVFG
jgi:hypothetical protein